MDDLGYVQCKMSGAGSWPPRLKNSLSGGGYVELSSFEHGPPTTTDWKSALAAAVAELLYTTVVRLPYRRRRRRAPLAVLLYAWRTVSSS